MKLVTGIIKPFKLDDVKDALAALDVQGLTVTEVQASFAGLPGPTVSVRVPSSSIDPSVTVIVVVSAA